MLAISVIVLLSVLFLPLPGAYAADPNPGVLPPNSKPAGTSYADWSAKWWTWVLQQPKASNPLFDDTGDRCANGQSGKVWFLAGTTGGTVTRSCTVPNGKFIYIPVANLVYVVTPGNPPGDSIDLAKEWLDTNWPNHSDLAAEIDGKSVGNLDKYAVRSPAFWVNLPAGNVFDLAAGKYQALAQGIQLMLNPLPPGKHTLHVHSKMGDSTIDATYDLTVKK